ncbi:MAG TPA: alpha/beta hydrolase [Anaerolineales bacterium]
MDTSLTGIERSLAQTEEYVRVSRMMVKVIAANARLSPVVEKKVRFGAHRQQYVVLHYPRQAVGARKPIIFFLHGGGWGHGNAGLFRFIGRFFAERGYPAIIGGYRLAPRYKFPSQVEDAYSGLRAGLELAAARGLDTESVVVAGQSAGAQLASLMLLDRENLQRHGFDPACFAGLLLVSGLLDFAYCRNWKDRDMLRKYLGRGTDWDRANPVKFVRGDETLPVLCIHGERDLLVDKANSISFIRKLKRTGELYLSHRAYHTDLTTMFLVNRISTKVMLRWLERVERLAHEARLGLRAPLTLQA